MFDRLNLRVGGGLLLAGGAIALWGALNPPREPCSYRFVDEVVAGAQKFRERRTLLDVNGCVVRGSIERRAGTAEYRFHLASEPARPPASLVARYTGPLPDMFRPGAWIVAKGRLGCDGALNVVADGIMTRCPSKHDSSAGPCCECP